ncbi:TauD-domain-containing protein [Mycena sanguinolenta]|uniref:TauD-domain-containing protein n=1 Tax=Mycena sanguinolenta TaxID=230812 RepID=A0A8H7CIE6_9AGAR|nr:TauD-domain-containing protein [Mycena sanguinolenta]
MASGTTSLPDTPPTASVEHVNIFHRYLFSEDAANSARKDETYKHTELLPTFPSIKWNPLELLKGLPEPGRNLSQPHAWKSGQLMNRQEIVYSEMSPSLGSEIRNMDLRTLGNAEKDELGAMLAERGLVVFRNQPNFTVDDQTALVSHFGPLYRHPTAGIPSEELSHIRVLYQGPESKPTPGFMSSVRQWHHDSPYELNPPGIISMRLLAAPPTGGDTVFSSGYDAYDLLSPGLQRFLEPLHAEHRPGQLDPLKMDMHARRPHTSAIHPVICVHPVTGWKTVFAIGTKGSTFGIVGLPQAESEMLIDFLGATVRDNINSQVRLQWDEETIALWDNRCVFHAATFNSYPHRRHAALISAVANQPMSPEEARAELLREPTSRAHSLDIEEKAACSGGNNVI